MHSATHIFALLYALLFATLATPAALHAQPPRALESRLELTHTLRDMMDFSVVRYDARVSLRIEASGAAVLAIDGTAEHRSARIPPPGAAPSTATASVPTREPMTDRWIGTARMDGAAIEVRFTRSEAFRPALAVDVLWRCEPSTVTIEATPASAYRCATAQRSTQPSGAAHYLPPYLQVPLYLAPPEARLSVRADARSGADHRAELSHATFHRAR